MQGQIEKIHKKVNISEQIGSLVAFGRKNSGWGNLLELREIEGIVFQVGNTWQEIEPLMTERDTLENQDIKSTIKIINDSYNELKDLGKSIKGILQDLKNSESIKIIKKSDAGLTLTVLQTQNNLTNFPTEIQDDIKSLVALMQEFQSLHTKWINSTSDFKKLLDSLNRYSDTSTEKGSGVLSSRFPKSPGVINKKTTSDNGWGWGKNRY